MSFFATWVYLRKNLRTVWPPNASLYASSTCVHLRLLAGPFGQGFTVLLLYGSVSQGLGTTKFMNLIGQNGY